MIRLDKMTLYCYTFSPTKRVRTLASTSDEFVIGVHGSISRVSISHLLFVVGMQEATRAARVEGLLELLNVNGIVITAESEEEAVRKSSVWEREMETRGLKVNINKTKLMVMDRKPVVRQQTGSYPYGVCDKEVGANSIWCQCSKRWCPGLRNLRKAGDNFKCPMYVRGVVAVPQRLEVGDNSLEMLDSLRYLGDVISCGAEVESAVRDRISSALSKWGELANLLVNHRIPLEERAKVYCACVPPAMLQAAEMLALTEGLEGLLASCDHKMLRPMSSVPWQDSITKMKR